MDRVERAIFSYLNRKREVYFEEFDAYMLKRFKALSQEGLHGRLRLLEIEGKVGWFNGHWHSNWPQDYRDRTTREANSFKCVRCGEYVETNGFHTVYVGNFHGTVCESCCHVIMHMRDLRIRKDHWRRMRSMGLDRLDDLECASTGGDLD